MRRAPTALFVEFVAAPAPTPVRSLVVEFGAARIRVERGSDGALLSALVAALGGAR